MFAASTPYEAPPSEKEAVGRRRAGSAFRAAPMESDARFQETRTGPFKYGNHCALASVQMASEQVVERTKPAPAIIDTVRLCGSAGAIAGLSASSTEETFATVTPKAAAWQTG